MCNNVFNKREPSPPPPLSLCLFLVHIKSLKCNVYIFTFWQHFSPALYSVSDGVWGSELYPLAIFLQNGSKRLTEWIKKNYTTTSRIGHLFLYHNQINEFDRAYSFVLTCIWSFCHIVIWVLCFFFQTEIFYCLLQCRAIHWSQRW